MSDVPPRNQPPADRPRRGTGGFFNQPYPGFGILWIILAIIFIWWIVAAFFYTPARFGWW